MKKLFFLSFIVSISIATNAQGIKNVLNKATKKDSAGNNSINTIFKKTSANGLTSDEIINGLKEALSIGTENAAQKLARTDGFFKDAVLKILMPPEAQKVEKTLRGLGMGKQVDNAILSMNRAAEDASKKAAPIFINAIKGMSIKDGLGILQGGDLAATNYLKEKTAASLAEAFKPVIESSLQKVDATKYWNTVFTTYNKFSSEKVNTDLLAYVTEKALAGLYYGIGQEEQKIRKDPMARTTELLKKVFSK
ncbi:MAG TPA: DUF4197 domain-containing protein [Chitinophagaceae bacterium]|jgi:hypothetical protein|nr:DUF4197 domain-containing protein [Chitinophagaceae bacterium]